MSPDLVAVVTGANRGIGFEICSQLARRGVCVVLTSRDAAKGKVACRTLSDEGLPVVFHRLDVTNPRSVNALAAFVTTTLGRVDILVNNAGVLRDPRSAGFIDSRLETYRSTFDTNIIGPLLVTQALLPLMMKRNYGRIVNMSSGLGQLAEMGNDTPAYRISKTALNALTRIVAAETKGTNVLVNSASPGWVRTDMGGPGAPRTVAEGADTAVWLATLPADGPTGGYFRDRQSMPW